jgi:hypothetical protein
VPMLVPFLGKRGPRPAAGIVKTEPKGVDWTKRDEAMAKKT